MSNRSLSDTWIKATAYLKDGVSLIPVRDKAAGEFAAKTPFYKWKDFQSRIATEAELWSLIETNDTAAIAIVCGKISGNMEVIDVDVKYKPGIDAILLNDIRTFYPDLFSRLRIHKTPSGGYHIIYRVNGGEVQGNLKLAGRLASDAELDIQKAKGVKRPNLEINFLETRGEGGYILSDLCEGYGIHIDNTIPTITWEERCSLITLCKTYNEIVKDAPAIKPYKSQDSIYDENPFEDFNKTVDPTSLIQSFGWKFSHENPHFIWYTRPDKEKGVSASWNKVKRVFYIFTSSTELQADRGYNPASVLAELMFAGDKSKTYHHLTSEGYGKVKKKVEQNQIKKAALTGTSIPANFSADAKKTFEDMKISLHEDHPYGIFWELDENNKIQISREGLYQVSDGLGFKLYKDEVVQAVDQQLFFRNERFYFDTIKRYIHEEDANLYEDICNAYEAFIQRSGSFTIERLKEITNDNILIDDADTAYKFFLNGILKITKGDYSTDQNAGIKLVPYSENEKLIWADKILNRNWVNECPETSKFTEYLHYAIGLSKYLYKIIGYLSHDYKDENTGYIIICTEACPDPKMGGGSGKSLFGLLLKNTTSVYAIPAEQAKLDEKLLQSWSYERVVMISDLPKGYNIGWFKDISTGYIIRKRLFKNYETVSPNDAPKFLFNSNHSYDLSDGGLIRRVIPIEFTDFFTKCGGVKKYFGGLFPTSRNGKSIWTDEDWSGYDWTIAFGIREYLNDPDLESGQLSEGGWEKQFKQKFNEHTFQFIAENFSSWIESGFILTKSFNNEYDAFCKENNLKNPLSGIRMNEALESYCTRSGYKFIKNKTHSITKDKCKFFEKLVTY